MCTHRQASAEPDTVASMTDSHISVTDDYTGHVDPGTAARRSLPGATIVKASVGQMDNNAYLVTCSRTGETLLIDAANDDLPDPDRPVKTIIASRGRSRSMPRRLCSRAPLTIRRSAN